MAITLDHTIVPAHDRKGFRSVGPFAAVKVSETSLDFDDAGAFEPHHYAGEASISTIRTAIIRRF